MAKFGYVLSDKKVFAGELMQFDFKKSTFTPDETPSVVSHEFSIDNTTWINVTPTKMIDWSFATIGINTVYLRLTSIAGSQVFPYTFEVLDLAAQKLFTTDFDLVAYEPDILKWLPKRWNSWNLIHLRAQDYILNTLSERRVLDKDGNPYTKDDIQDKKEVRDWSAALVLRYIFSGISNADNDVFKAKSDQYDDIESTRSATARLSLDYNKNSIADDPKEDLRSIELRRA